MHGDAEGGQAPAVLLVRRTDSVDIRLQLERAAGLVQRAREALVVDDAAGAARALALSSEAITLAPSSADAFLERSRAHLAVFRRDSAALAARDQCIRDARRAAFMKPASWRCALQLSRAHVAAGELDEGLRALGEAEALARADAEGESAAELAFTLEDQRGRLQLEQGKAAKARGTVEQAWMWLLADAVTSLDRALAAKPRSADTLNNRGVAYYEARAYAPALADFEAALRVDAAHDRALSNRALVQRLRRELHAAHASLSAAIAHNPASAVSFNNLGCIERDLGRLPAALLSFERAAEMDSAYEQARTNRDTVLSELRHPVPIRPVADVPLPPQASR
ncbi:hypothetical protein KFE25_008367 [Diacronema lutheri]|uniref:Tetratricopeptide repeat protein n=1 Tax=Diacronema lutheri TaxID=2081491 RepID=A0A8J6CGS1_DIALT|nr:hypothetical protein KFE25_008367 [Diacronema lutheri]